ncbi:ArsJ-associated glyceraldehyde-3-phosphate dehydrogenase [Rhodobaculum claviforme]|uniref:Glyceraldehyde-3-phosphate dehydrogenase n=1 Tax=Rhodobaculum claviforme TaxID=1549854 RepID=A0A934WI59_9RHOB|nr:ArsJ-associated glyceraldehyde-3-phosphate dehydrogenase [Rhodobaculum claviforme]MBK5926417.1 glyceraldehyde-3-phosphate dehydrogenase [Rhodobaculum claviforme]
MASFALNGLGRIGKLALREMLARGIVPAWINDAVGDPAMHAHLLEFDSVHGRWPATFSHDADSVTVDGARLPFIGTARLSDLPLAGVDVLIDCTGAHRTAAALAPALEGGAGRVVIAAPVHDPQAVNIVAGINNAAFDPARHRIVTAASCTTNCLAPVVKVIHEGFGIRHGSITTIHDVTNTQTLVDRPAKDLRRARSALTSLIPTSTGSASAIGLIFPDLAGRLDGLAVRVPLLNASLTDCVFEVSRPTTVAEVNAALSAAAAGPLRGILGYEDRPLVSADYRGDTRSAIVDAACTRVIGGTQVKIYAWYDNETGYAHRLVDVVQMVGAA